MQYLSPVQNMHLRIITHYYTELCKYIYSIKFQFFFQLYFSADIFGACVHIIHHFSTVLFYFYSAAFIPTTTQISSTQ